LAANRQLAEDAYWEASLQGADLVVFGELSLCGYGIDDLATDETFQAATASETALFAAATTGVPAFVGALGPHPHRYTVDAQHRDVTNVVAVCASGGIHAVTAKTALPDYGVFDETRWFAPGPANQPHVTVTTRQGATLAVATLVCEDMWDDRVADARVPGADLVLVANASPWEPDKQQHRLLAASQVARRHHVPLVYVNLVGGQDDVVFDGASFVLDADGSVIWIGPSFEPCLAMVDVPVPVAAPDVFDTLGRVPLPVPDLAPLQDHPTTPSARPLKPEEELWSALRLAVTDYVTKNGFDQVWVGLSGGIDSAVVAALAVDALGPGQVHGVAMPGPYSSDRSLADARQLADNLGVDLEVVSITDMVVAATGALADLFDGRAPDVAEENIQARLRGLVLMAASNKLGGLVLSTGNKSETSVGYCTLYGDMAGGFAPLKDVAKTDVYRLARWRNTLDLAHLAIPVETIDRPPSAELAPDQTDEASLGSYEDLDAVLGLLIDDRLGTCAIAEKTGLPAAYVERVTTLVDQAEHKRRQAPPGPKVSRRAFGRDRRVPITTRWHHPPADTCQEVMS
jgi:NAD+ synthase (glutamine-hydrolysing)